MKRKIAILERLESTALKLRADLTRRFVFCGGSVAPLLITDEAAHDSRPTKDVDVIAKILTRVEYYSLSEQLAKVGFVVAVGEDVICRYRNGDLILDVMPTHENVLGFSNKWYEAGFDQSFVYHLSENCPINVISPPYFLCTKLEAHQERSKRTNDEKDLEDVIHVVDGRPELIDELLASPTDVKMFVGSSIEAIINDGVLSKLDWFLPQDSTSGERMQIVADA